MIKIKIKIKNGMYQMERMEQMDQMDQLVQQNLTDRNTKKKG